MGEYGGNARDLFHTSMVHEHGVPVVAVQGDLDLAAKPRLKEQLRRAAAGAASRVAEGNSVSVVVDLSGLSFMDAVGLGVLLEYRGVLRERGGDLWLVTAESDAAYHLLRIVQLEQVLRVHPDRSSAIKEINEVLRQP